MLSNTFWQKTGDRRQPSGKFFRGIGSLLTRHIINLDICKTYRTYQTFAGELPRSLAKGWDLYTSYEEYKKGVQFSRSS
jgi:hypothetical protein